MFIVSLGKPAEYLPWYDVLGPQGYHCFSPNNIQKLIVEFCLSRTKDPNKWWGMLYSPMDCIIIWLASLVGMIFTVIGDQAITIENHVWRNSWPCSMEINDAIKTDSIAESWTLLKLMTLDHVSWSRLGFRPEVFGEFNSVEHYPVFT